MPRTCVITFSAGFSAKHLTAFSNALIQFGHGVLLGAAAPILSLLFHPGAWNSSSPSTARTLEGSFPFCPLQHLPPPRSVLRCSRPPLAAPAALAPPPHRHSGGVTRLSPTPSSRADLPTGCIKNSMLDRRRRSESLSPTRRLQTATRLAKEDARIQFDSGPAGR